MVNIALANEFALICEQLDVDIYDAIALANRHPRVKIHAPGPGVGGYCLPKDPWFLIGNILTENSELIRSAFQVNEKMPFHVADLITKALRKKGKNIKRSRITIFGLAYKGNIADTRNSPSKTLISYLKKKGASICVYDPHAKGDDERTCTDIIACVNNADAIIVMCDHDEFKKIDFDELLQNTNDAIIIDTRNIVRRSKKENEV